MLINGVKSIKTKIFYFLVFYCGYLSISDIYEAKNAYKWLEYKEKWDFLFVHTLSVYIYT